ncbi:MAG: HD domain-containing protein [Bacteroidales bacterium]|nr:HD domain-containing protein [Bacteroidales bacterium]
MTDTYKELLKGIDPSLVEYIEGSVIPRYASFDKAHRQDHAHTVIARALEMADNTIDRNVVYAAAACHDLGLSVDRATHHLESGKIIRQDAFLQQFFGPEKLEIVAQAAEDHRASSKSEPRGIYGRLVAEADRLIEPITIIRRTVQFGLDHYPDLDTEGHWERTLQHLREKYGDGGYLKLWIPGSPNEAKLEELRVIIRNPQVLREVFNRIWEEERNF